MTWILHDLKNQYKLTDFIVNFSHQLLGFQAKFMLSCSKQADFYNKAYFYLYSFILFIYYNTISFSTWRKEEGLLEV